MKAIVTKYFGPTDHKGSRIRVSAEGVKSRTYSYDHGAQNAHHAAAVEFAAHYKWDGYLEEGGLPNGRDRVFVMIRMPKLVLWKLQRSSKPVHGEQRGFVICAETETEARELAAAKAWNEGAECWRDVTRSSCHRLHAADPGVVLADTLHG